MRYVTILILSTALLFLANILFGSVSIPADAVINILLGNESEKSSWNYIVVESRLPQAITALLSGMALSVSGLMLQTAFRNPLADPSIFGISSGAGLGAAFVMLLFGGTMTAGQVSFSGYAAVFFGAFLGAMAVMAVVFAFSLLVRNSAMLLIVGIMIGYIASSAISLLNFFATEEGVKSYLVWGLGSFGGVSMRQLPLFTTVTILSLLSSLLLIKPLNIIQLGRSYAENLGIRTHVVRNCLLVITGLLTAVVTSFCGPVSFIGLAVPHLSRMMIRTSHHGILMPVTMLTGSVVALFCNLISTLPSSAGLIPLNAITPVLGAPVVIFVIMRKMGGID
ncbi:iron ABC transporter permease [Prevotella sp. P2-180]|uniref:iron ABC transporter permease n=1 Tax=Prevotella sp. P2-180 TaxID=2024224 RepID=UPI000B96AF96|nr:iron ABC transporter permease [Prevotella sp. P2-180]OYP69043.1 iron ABC transporter [Prevotella sp. P2-180]